MTEEFRPYPLAPDSYLVSESGVIYSLPRIVKHPYGVRRAGGRNLKATLSAHGYPYHNLRIDGIPTKVFVHAAVMETFVGPKPEGMEICHWDDQPTNNHVTNLRYGTHSDNALDSVRNNNHNNARKTHCPMAHEFTAGNTKYGKKHNGRYCLTCIDETNRLKVAGRSRSRQRRLALDASMRLSALLEDAERNSNVRVAN